MIGVVGKGLAEIQPIGGATWVADDAGVELGRKMYAIDPQTRRRRLGAAERGASAVPPVRRRQEAPVPLAAASESAHAQRVAIAAKEATASQLPAPLSVLCFIVSPVTSSFIASFVGTHDGAPASRRPIARVNCQKTCSPCSTRSRPSRSSSSLTRSPTSILVIIQQDQRPHAAIDKRSGDALALDPKLRQAARTAVRRCVGGRQWPVGEHAGQQGTDDAADAVHAEHVQAVVVAQHVLQAGRGTRSRSRRRRRR